MALTLNDVAVVLWRSGNREECIRLYQAMVGDATLYDEMRQHYSILTYNMGKVTNSSQGTKIAILCYESSLVGHWDPSTTSVGLPGSEEAVVYASTVLAKRGYNVTVYANPLPQSPWSLPLANPRWLHVGKFTKDHDVVIMWRRVDFHVAKSSKTRVYFWPHDSPFYQLNTNNLDGIFFLSQHHKNQFITKGTIVNVPHVISGNGIELDHFTGRNHATNPYSCGYYSNYTRGLYTLLSVWPDVRKRFPQATLDIYYGRETWVDGTNNLIANIVSKIEEMKDSVMEHGRVGHKELARAMESTSIFTYPCNTTAETFCITAIKAQAAGMVPVTTRIGALDETIHPRAPTIPRAETDAEVATYLVTLLETMETIANVDRDVYVNFAREFTWSSTVDKWLSIM